MLTKCQTLASIGKKIAPCIVDYIFQPIPSEEIMETVPGTMTGWLTSVGESTIG